MIEHVNKNSSLYEALLEARVNFPFRYAMRYMHRSYRYFHVVRRVNQFASALKKLGVKKGDVIASALPNTPDAIYLIYAVNQLGAINNIIHPLSNYHQLKENFLLTKPKIAFVLSLNYQKLKPLEKELGIKLISSSPSEDLPLFMRLIYKLKTKKQVGKIKKSDSTHRFYFEKEEKEFDKDFKSDAFYLHSSGVTGSPKTVALSNFAINALVSNGPEFLSLTTAENIGMLAVLPMFHGFGLAVGIHALLAHGGVIVLMPKFSSKEVIKYLKKNQIHFLIGVPLLFESLLAQPKFKGDIVSCLRLAFIGGDFVSRSLINRFNDRMLDAGSSCRLKEGYGLTETVNVCAVNTLNNDKIGTVGKSLPNVKLKIVNEKGETLPPNVEGELLVSGETLMNGYRFSSNPKINEEVFVIDENGVKWVKTGDFCSLDEEGFLTYKQRIKRIVKVNGINVFPSQIEEQVSKLDIVFEVAATGTEDKSHGHMIKLFVVLSKNAKCSEDEAKKLINQVIFDNCGVFATPKEIVFLKSFPHTMLGKIDTKLLK